MVCEDRGWLFCYLARHSFHPSGPRSLQKNHWIQAACLISFRSFCNFGVTKTTIQSSTVFGFAATLVGEGGGSRAAFLLEVGLRCLTASNAGLHKPSVIATWACRRVMISTSHYHQLLDYCWRGLPGLQNTPAMDAAYIGTRGTLGHVNLPSNAGRRGNVPPPPSDELPRHDMNKRSVARQGACRNTRFLDHQNRRNDVGRDRRRYRHQDP